MDTRSQPVWQRLLKPRNIALIGASERAPHAAALMRNLFRFGFPRDRIYPVNPRYEQLFDLRCYPSVGAVPGDVDLAVIAIPRDGTVQVMEECAAKGVRAALTVATGFGEFDDTGRKYQAELSRIVREHGIALAGPNTLGYLALECGAALWSSPLPRSPYHRTGERGVQQRRPAQPVPQHGCRPLPGVSLRHRPGQSGGRGLHRLPAGGGGRRRHPGHRRRDRVHEPSRGDGGAAGPCAGAREGGHRAEAGTLPKGRARGHFPLGQHGHLRRGVGRVVSAEGRDPGGQPGPDAGSHRPGRGHSGALPAARRRRRRHRHHLGRRLQLPRRYLRAQRRGPARARRTPPTRRCAATSTRRVSTATPWTSRSCTGPTAQDISSAWRPSCATTTSRWSVAA